jgi:quercetin dioxygenase-like cupin family protein
MRFLMLALGLVFITGLAIQPIFASEPALGRPGTMSLAEAVPPGAVDVTIEPLGAGLPAAADGYKLSLLRVTFAPGGSIGTHTHPGSLVLTIAEGALAYAIIEGEAEVVRVGAAGQPGPTERISAGKEVILNPGDSLFEQGIVHTARNVSDGQTVVLISGLMEPEQPFTSFFEPVATR